MLVGPTCLYNDYIDYINGNNILKYQVWIRLVLHSTAASECINLRKFKRKKIFNQNESFVLKFSQISRLRHRSMRDFINKIN